MTESPHDTPDTPTPQHDAEAQLVNAMLLQLGSDEAAQNSARVQRVMQAIEAKSQRATSTRHRPHAHRPIRQSWPLLRWAVVSTLILIVGFGVLYLPDNAAVASIDRIIQSIDQHIDRTYIITGQFERGFRRGDFSQPTPKRKRFANLYESPPVDGGVLYVRGADQFVLVTTDDQNQPITLGSDGQTSWLLTDHNPPRIESDPHAFRAPLPGAQTRIPFIDLKTALVELKTDFTIHYLGVGALQGQGATQFDRFRCEANTRARNQPNLVHIWAHPETGAIQRLQFDGRFNLNYPNLQRLTIDLVDQQPLPHDWFTPTPRQ
jgi:hypothetical protein